MCDSKLTHHSGVFICPLHPWRWDGCFGIALLVGLMTTSNLTYAQPNLQGIQQEWQTIAKNLQHQFRNQLLNGISCQKHTEVTDIGISGQQAKLLTSSTVKLFYSFPCYAIEFAEQNNYIREKKNLYSTKVNCVNEKYGFDIRKSTSSAPWVVRDIDTHDMRRFLLQGRHEGLSSLKFDELLSLGIDGLDIEGNPIDSFIAQNGIKITTVTKESDGSVAIHFVGDVATPYGDDRVQDGTVWLALERSWSINRYKANLESNYGSERKVGIVERTVQWSTIDGMEVPSVVETQYTASGEPTRQIRTEYSNWVRQRYPASRFQLQHYGLPEPGLTAC